MAELAAPLAAVLVEGICAVNFRVVLTIAASTVLSTLNNFVLRNFLLVLLLDSKL